MKFVKPQPNQSFTVTATPDWPSIEFETDATGPHSWQWTIEWGVFKKTGTAATADNKWNAKTAVTNSGGTLTVRAEANTPSPGAATGAAVSPTRVSPTRVSATISVKLKGTSPGATAANAYLATKPNSSGFGWDMNDADDTGKTEAELHKRDSGTYSNAPAVGAHWKYLGICYADRVLG